MEKLNQLYQFVYQNVIFFLIKISIKKNLYYLWSKFYRWLYQKKFLKTKLEKNLEPLDAQEMMRTLNWRRDSVKELWDSISSPNWVQYCINEVRAGRRQPDGSLDCDDFAAWACNVINENYNPRIYIQIWHPILNRTEVQNKIRGHVVCILEKNGKIYHCGNWGLFGPFEDLKSVGMHVSEAKYKRGLPVKWATMDKDLKLLASGNGVPEKGLQ